MMMSLLLLIFSLSIIFSFLNHPLSFGGILLAQTIIVSLFIGMLNYNYWFSYILFLIMIGGMLVLFIYMTSVASNEKFKFSPLLLYFFMLTIMLIILMLFMDYYFLNLNMINYDLINQSLQFKNEISMSKYMNYPNNIIMFTMMIYLLITLIAVVKITKTNYGPLRQKF